MSENQSHSNTLKEANSANAAGNSSRLSEIIFVLLGTMLVFSAVAFGAVDTWALGVNSFLAELIVVLWLADAFSKREFSFSLSRLQIPLLALILIGIFQLLPFQNSNIAGDLISIPTVKSLSLAPYQTRLAIVQFVVYFIYFAAALVFINSENRLRKIVSFIITFSALMAFYGILQRLANLEAIYGLRPFNQAIPFASFVNQHHFAAFMEMIIGLTLGLLFGRATKSNKRIFLIIAVIIMGIAIVLTGSRGGLISLLGVLVFIIAANFLKKSKNSTDAASENNQNYRRNFVLIGGGLTLILVLFGSVLLLGGDESLLRGVGLQNSDDISNGRLHFWQIAWRIFLDNPVSGAGLDAFGTAFPLYDSWNGTFRVEQAHNDYLQILADAGIAGFACIASFIILLFKQSSSIVSKSKDSFRRGAAIGALAGCFGILIHSFFDFPLRTSSNAFFFLTLTVIATVSINSSNTSRRKHKKRIEEQ